MAKQKYYRVSSDPYDAPLDDFLQHGYEERIMFFRGVLALVQRWHDRVGLCVGSRNGFFLLRFHDTPGGKPDEAWIPDYLLKPACMPEEASVQDPDDGMTEEIDKAFGFD